MREKKELKKKEKRKQNKQTHSSPPSPTHHLTARPIPAHLTPPACLPLSLTPLTGGAHLSGLSSTSSAPAPFPCPAGRRPARRLLASPRRFPSLQVRGSTPPRRPSHPRPFLSPETAAHRAPQPLMATVGVPPSTASPAAPPLPSPPIKRRPRAPLHPAPLNRASLPPLHRRPKEPAGAPRLAADPLRRRLFFLFESLSGFLFSPSSFWCFSLAD
jgi:hypothetical protein